MICEKCQGTGFYVPRFKGEAGLEAKFVIMTPNPICSDCGGSGIGYCCDTAGSSQAPTDIQAPIKKETD